MKKWKNSLDIHSLFLTTHKDAVGGGELYAHQIAEALDYFTDMRYYGPPPKRAFLRNHSLKTRFTHTSLMSPCDVFVSASHFRIPQPAGTHRNISVCYFPDRTHRELIKPYDTIITTSHFCATWIKKYWNKKAHVIHPYLDAFWKYPRGNKKKPNTIINVGRFFSEPDGHGKRQDVLIEAFSRLSRRIPDATLHLAGSVTSGPDRNFVGKLHQMAKDLGVEENVHIHIQPDIVTLKKLYLESEVYWHANGYKQEDPFKTEHFGIVICEAMACGCEPIIYKHGGYEEFGCSRWEEIDELVESTVEQLTMPKPEGFDDMWVDLSSRFSKDNLFQGVRNLIQR